MRTFYPLEHWRPVGGSYSDYYAQNVYSRLYWQSDDV